MQIELAKYYDLQADSIWVAKDPFASQEAEHQKRKEIAEALLDESYEDIIKRVSKNYSIPVMDREVRNFLRGLPDNALIVDVGGGVGWHWRNIAKIRPDVTVVVVDFLLENLIRAKRIFSPNLINSQVYLVNGNALNLKFSPESFDGYWSVQAIQHIPDYDGVIKEAYRVLKKGGRFINYSLNNQSLVRNLYRVMGKNYPIHAFEPCYYLIRADENQKKKLAKTFNNSVTTRMSEILFSPELKFTLPGKKNSMLGKLDALLSNDRNFFGFIARQQSFMTQKN